MPSQTRSRESQGKIEFRTRKSLRSSSSNVKNLEDLKGSRPYRRKYQTSCLGPSEAISPAVDLRASSRPLFVEVTKVDRSCKLNPIKPRNFTSDSKIPSPRKRLFQDEKPNKENSKHHSKQNEDLLQPSPVKQIKTEPERVAHDMKDKNSASNRRTTLCISKQEGKQYGLIRQQLHASIPERLFCREKETSIISNFIAKGIKGTKSGSLYVSGAPGTGKTVCLSKVLEQMKEDGLVFKDVWINCMSLNQSANIYQKIASQITNEDVKCKTSEKYLEKVFQSSGAKIVLILDEIDQLESKNQEILYKIFEWPSLPNSRVILVGIANALDLTDRILPRLQSNTKCHPELVQFSPYNKDQISEILNERLREVNDGLVDKNTVQFCARKVAAVAGDMRKALDIMRRSVELVEIEAKQQRILTSVTNSPSKDATSKSLFLQKVTLSHVARVVSEVYNSNLSSNSAGKESLPLQQKVFICSLLLLSKKEKSKDLALPKLYAAYCSVCQRRQLNPVSQEEFTSICQLVEARGIVTVKQGKNMRYTMVSLRLQESEVEHALKDKTLLSSILEGGIAKTNL